MKSDKEKLVNEYAKRIMCSCSFGKSYLRKEIEDVYGFVCPWFKHFMNKICGYPNIRFLNIGLFKGSSWTCALDGNSSFIDLAVGVDNFSEFQDHGNSMQNLQHNCNKLESYSDNYHIIEGDCFADDTISKIKEVMKEKKFNLYFYDGRHTIDDHQEALTKYFDLLDDVFIFIVDDWVWNGPKVGTTNGLSMIPISVDFKLEIPSFMNNDPEWWNGYFIGVARKNWGNMEWKDYLN